MVRNMRRLPSLILSVSLLVPMAARSAESIPTNFDSTGSDRKAIEELLSIYTRSVSTKDRAGFESILKDTHIPFSEIGAEPTTNSPEKGLHSYDDFAKEIFDGPSLNQTFQNVSIGQDGSLANVTLVFINQGPSVSSWGWKTLQLVRSGERWKIASEFFTLHSNK